jgi:FAD/FMN-containing dehydrogenase
MQSWLRGRGRLGAARADLRGAELRGASLKHDVTVPVSSIAAFVARTDRELQGRRSGDSHRDLRAHRRRDLHYNLSEPEGSAHDAFRGRAGDLARVVYDSVGSFDGSISPEHGLGQSKAGMIGDYKDAYELQLMRGVKELFDPAGLRNPGKVLPNA